MSPKAIPRQSGKGWDERRNTSQVRQVDPRALGEAKRAMEHFRRTQPALADWIADGHPSLTHAEHVARFGEAYTRTRTTKPKEEARL